MSQVVRDDEALRDWLALPRRIYLDTCTLQAVHDYGDVIWDGEPFVPRSRAAKVKDYDKDLEALQMILLVNERAMFEFVVTETNLREVAGITRGIRSGFKRGPSAVADPVGR